MIGVLFCHNGGRWIMMSLVDMIGFPTVLFLEDGGKNTWLLQGLL